MTIVQCKKTITMPAGATIKKNTVVWHDKRGNRKTGTLTPNGRVLVECRTFQIEYRDENGKRRRESTNLTSRESALHLLTQRTRDVQRIKAGIVSRQELQQQDVCQISVAVLIEKYLNHIRSADKTEKCISGAARMLRELTAAIDAKVAADITADKVESWIVAERQRGKRAAGTINSYVKRLKSFCRWTVKNEYITKNNTANIPRLNESADRRKIRRALTEKELSLLFDATHNKRDSRQDNVELIYRLLVGTGLRSNELSLATVSQFDFTRRLFRVDAAKTKNRKADMLPVHPDLIKRLKQYVHQKNIPSSDRIFHYHPSQLLRWFYSDLKSAGVDRISDDGRSLDVHSLRKTFGTMLARAGVPLTTTQRLMRHATPTLTAKLYIDVDQIDMQDALEKLPVM